ncbi:Uncharacterised protein [Mycobacterium tuberculosis]|uniref:Uncharacterized protein n=1 Tax=Mycobacterium tuberculosis TaxID=1773 RepID=A0A655AKE3_MYCTX|nr:Uncharacterised protein [Mycobacterium tuberculosis]CKR69814.1 Uncharacterised protein [Mycobacterium tuberculosis]CKR86587.1 Uncharacterised protein [Mycobacterium tuberculosis]CKT05842.1 Uncharacterised protein [Mycobacterium tuberculosis]CKT11747.1 Uncharacterised protein [Mycobacterium tuberculosis]
MVSRVITDSYDAAVVPNSAARPFHAAPAAIIGPAPAPAYMRAELISGGKAPKSMGYSVSVELFG